MATEITNTAWIDALRFEPSVDVSDITSGDALGGVEDILPHWGMLRERFAMWLSRAKKIDSRERGLEFVSQPITYQEEYLQVGENLFKFCEPNNKSYYFGEALVHKVSGAVVWATTSKVQERIPELTVTPEVVAESETDGYRDELETAIELAQTTYTSLKKIDLLLERDPEIPDRETLRFILTVSGKPEKILEEEGKFKKQIRNTIRRELREKITVTYYWK
jgi:hypothetical protein